MVNNETTRQALLEILGADSILTDAADVAPYLTDHRKLYHGRALAVILPRTTQQISRVLGFCNEHRIGVVPHGGNTGYCGGATPDESGDQIVLSLRRLNHIRSVDPSNYSLVARGRGLILADVQRAADAD